MPLEFDTTDELLNFVSDGGVPRTHAQGYEWFWNVFTPALNAASPRTQEEIDRLVDCHYAAGDVHDFNNAPLAAIEEYKKALSYDPEHASSYREIANMQEDIGELEQAKLNIERALELAPEDECALSDREDILMSLEDKDFSPLYKSGDIRWSAFEALAKGDAESALDVSKGPKNSDEMRVHICALGALERHDAYIATWREVLTKGSEIIFDQYDWFFTPGAVYDNPEIWKLFLDSDVKFGGVFAVFKELENSNAYSSLSTDAKIRLRMEYYLYHHSENIVGLKRLLETYPEWGDVEESLTA